MDPTIFNRVRSWVKILQGTVISDLYLNTNLHAQTSDAQTGLDRLKKWLGIIEGEPILNACTCYIRAHKLYIFHTTGSTIGELIIHFGCLRFLKGFCNINALMMKNAPIDNSISYVWQCVGFVCLECTTTPSYASQIVALGIIRFIVDSMNSPNLHQKYLRLEYHNASIVYHMSRFSSANFPIGHSK